MKEDWQKRWDNLEHKRVAFHQIYPNTPNPDAYFRDFILNESDEKLAKGRFDAILNAHGKYVSKLRAQETKKADPLVKLREERNKKLLDTDYTQLSDSPVSSDVKKEYKKYRQHLRDLPYLIAIQAKLDYSVPTFEEWCELEEIKIIKG